MPTMIKRTGLGHGEAGTCHYIGDDETVAHNLTQLRQRYSSNPKMLDYINKYDAKRNIALAGIGVRTCGWRYTAKDFHRLSHIKLHNKVKTINLVISPEKGTINPHNLNQVETFKTFCIRYVKTVFPYHKAYIAVQHDNKGMKSQGGITHAHLIISAISTLSPHNGIPGWRYDNNYLKDRYNLIAHQFNQEQDVMHLGRAVPSVKHQKEKAPTRTDKWLLSRSESVLDKLEAGRLKNRTEVCRAFRQQGIMFKVKQHRHRQHLRDINGHLEYRIDKLGHRHSISLYKKYTSGPRKGQYMYRTNKHGNRSKIPVYSYSAGIALKPIRKLDQRPKRKRRYIHGSRLQRISGDNRFNGKWVLTVLYQLKKGTYQVPVKYQKHYRKEKINHERRRFSENYLKRIRLLRGNSTPAEPAPRPVFTVNTQSARQSGSDTRASQQTSSEANEQRTQQERQRHASILTSFLTAFNQACRRLKRLHLKAKALRLKRRIDKAITRRVARIRTKVEERIRNIEAQRHNQREAELRHKRHRQWEREQGGREL